MMLQRGPEMGPQRGTFVYPCRSIIPPICVSGLGQRGPLQPRHLPPPYKRATVPRFLLAACPAAGGVSQPFFSDITASPQLPCTLIGHPTDDTAIVQGTIIHIKLNLIATICQVLFSCGVTNQLPNYDNLVIFRFELLLVLNVRPSLGLSLASSFNLK